MSYPLETYPLEKVLIANRGEIALRIIRACRELKLKTVAVHSTVDSDAMHVRLADESVCIGGPAARDSYLNIPNILSAASITGAQAIHPGFGFLSENARFAEMVASHQLIFIGPSPEHIAAMGHKTMAKEKAQELGFPLIQGSPGEVLTIEEGQRIAQNIGYPVLIKASAGGGGKGMRIVSCAENFAPLFQEAQSEAKANFGHDGVYIEQYLQAPRHIEFQIIGDHYGNVVCLGDRDCSLQRRYQKIWEEAPSACITTEERCLMMDLCVKAMKKLGYVNAGTLEFLYEKGRFYFIEMNTRIQVEHPVTEMVTGIDLVKEQIRVAMGYPLSFSQEDIVMRGHAIECRINAEDPETFAPSPGKVDFFCPPGGPFVRTDSALFPGYKVPPHYDSLVAKLVAHGKNREECLQRVERMLQECVITGIKTLLPLHLDLCQDPDVQRGDFYVKWLEEVYLKKEKLP